MSPKWIRSFNPSVRDAFTRWTGKIVGFDIHDERTTTSPFAVLRVVRDGEASATDVFVGFPLKIDGVSWTCKRPVSAPIFRYEFHICDALPPSIVLGETKVTLTVWYQEYPARKAVVPATDTIFTRPAPPLPATRHIFVRGEGSPGPSGRR